MFATLIGQDKVEEIDSDKRINSVMISTLVSSTKVGLGFKYKSLYSINNIIKAGWGAGLESYSSNLERNFIPISFEVIGDVYEHGRTPFYMFSLGYGIPLQEVESFATSSRGGLMVDISVGYRSKMKATQPFISAGYHLQHASYKGEDSSGNDNKDVQYKRWSLSIGTFF